MNQSQRRGSNAREDVKTYLTLKDVAQALDVTMSLHKAPAAERIRLPKRMTDKPLLRARYARALATGALKRGKCAVGRLGYAYDCIGKIHGHHPSYDMADATNVIWLCQRHHALIHLRHYVKRRAEIESACWKSERLA